MKAILHKHPSFKKLTCTVVLLVMGWFVHADGFKDYFNYDEVKVVKFYPNPATSFINFEFADNIDKTYILEIYSFTGRKIVEIPVSANRITVTLSNDFYRGIYVFHLRDKSGKQVDVGKFQVIK